MAIREHQPRLRVFSARPLGPFLYWSDNLVWHMELCHCPQFLNNTGPEIKYLQCPLHITSWA